MTCAHCIENAVDKGVTITVPAYTKFVEQSSENKDKNLRVDIIAVFPAIDGALLKINDEKFDPKDMQFEAFELGDDTTLQDNDLLHIYGFPLGMFEIKTIESHYNGREKFKIQLDGGINEGHSGSAVLLRNKVIGFVTSGVMFANNVSFATPIGLLTPLLKAVDLSDTSKNIQIIRQGGLGFNTYPSYNELKNFYHSNNNGGILVEYIHSLSPLKNTLQPNDLIYAIRQSKSKNEESKSKKEGWYELTRDGNVHVNWKGSTQSISMKELLQRWSVEAPVDIKYFDVKEKKEQTLKNQKLDYFPINGTLELKKPWDGIDYEVIAGIVVVPLSSNDHVKSFAKHIKRENLDQPALVITRVISPSDASATNVDITGVLKSVNNIPVKTLDEFREALKKDVDGYLVFENEKNKLLVLNVEKVKEKEEQLAKENQYEISKFFSK
jgi:S1-C subfamily serine protease